MVSDQILASYIGSEVVLRFANGSHTSGILDTVDKDMISLKMTDGSKRAILRSKIKYVEGKPPGSKEFEEAVKNELQKLIKSKKAKDEKEAVKILKKMFSKDIKKK